MARVQIFGQQKYFLQIFFKIIHFNGHCDQVLTIVANFSRLWCLKIVIIYIYIYITCNMLICMRFFQEMS